MGRRCGCVEFSYKEVANFGFVSRLDRVHSWDVVRIGCAHHVRVAGGIDSNAVGCVETRVGGAGLPAQVSRIDQFGINHQGLGAVVRAECKADAISGVQNEATVDQ